MHIGVAPAGESGGVKRRLGLHELVAACAGDRANPLPVYELAEECLAQGDRGAWRRAIEMAFGLAHTTYEHLFLRGRAKLALGDWSGWTDYEARLFKPHASQSRLARELRWSRRAWDGHEHLGKRTLFVIKEQGFGDTIQMLRFLPAVATRASEVRVAIQPELLSWVQHNFGDMVTVVGRDTVKPDLVDVYVRIMSLPALIGELPPFVPLKASQPRPPVGGYRQPTVGICWAGSPSYAKDSQRSLELMALAPLLTHDDIAWVNLYVGARDAEAAAFPNIQAPMPPLTSFEETANLIATLDAVVTCDTAVCHVAGSLGVPTFLLLPYASHWRWGLGERSVWYPSVRFFRQAEPGDWRSAVERVAREIANVARSERPTASPV